MRFIRLIVSRPFMPGMWMSMKIMSMAVERAISSAFVPLEAEKIVICPSKFLFKIIVRESITICSSSVKRMLYIAAVLYPYAEFRSAARIVLDVKDIVVLEVYLKARYYVYQAA